jgi:hypothetical protein
VTFKAALVFHRRANLIRSESATFSAPIVTDKSRAIVIFFARQFSCDHIDLHLDITKFGSITHAVISWKFGEISHLHFQLAIRILFGFVSILLSTLFFVRMKAVALHKWTLRQKLTILFGIAAVLGFNPFFSLYVCFPSFLHEILNTVLFHLFMSYARLFILLVLDDLADYFSPCSKLFFCGLQFAVEIASQFVSNDQDLILMEEMRILFTLVFVVWFMVLVMEAYNKVKPDDRFRLGWYGFVFLVAVGLNLFDKQLERLSVFKNSSGLFALHFSSLQAFVMVMIFEHWPYEFEREQPH